MRKIAIPVILGVFFIGFVFSVGRMENLRANGTDILLPLAPVDPRALLMGDYMALDFVVNEDIMNKLRQMYDFSSHSRHEDKSNVPSSGLAVVVPTVPKDRRGKELADLQSAYPVMAFVRMDDGTPLGPGELLLAFKVRGGRTITASTAFYFQEGDAKDYERAQFGRVKLDENGKTLLVALCDGEGRDIVPERLPRKE